MSSAPEDVDASKKHKLFDERYALPIVIVLAAAMIISSWLSQPENVLVKDFTDFTITTLSGDTFSVNESNEKIVVINFMHTSCAYCRAEIPELKRIWTTYSDRIVLLSVSIDPFSDTEAVLREFAESYDADWIWARDVSGVAAEYRVEAVPITVILDRQGYVKYVKVGFADASAFGHDLDELLNSD